MCIGQCVRLRVCVCCGDYILHVCLRVVSIFFCFFTVALRMIIYPPPSKREPALSVAARHLSQRERQVWIVRKTKAFLPEEGGTAQAVTEGAARGQVCIRENLMRILPICKTPSVFACGKSSSLEEGASPLCRCATSLPEGETSLDCAENQSLPP